MKELMSPDAISGKEGKAFAKINGNNEDMFFARTIEAIVEKTKTEIKAIGKRMVGNKTTGIKGTGSMTIYYLSPIFRNLIADYKRTGRDAYFDMVVENDDPASSAGKQSVLLRGVNLNSTVLTKLDGDSDDPLVEEAEFTFEDYEILTPFNKV